MSRFKRILLTIALTSTAALPQRSESMEKLGLGFRFGSNYNWATMDNFFFVEDSVKSQAGFSLGATVQAQIGQGWDLALDILANRSALFFLSNAFSLDAYQYRFWSIDIPVVLYFSPIPEFFVGVGGYASLGVGKISRMGSYTGYGDSGSPLYKDDTSSYSREGWKKVHYGGVAALGISAPYGNSGAELYFESRLYWGFSDRLDSFGGDLKNRAVDVAAGMIFNVL